MEQLESVPSYYSQRDHVATKPSSAENKFLRKDTYNPRFIVVSTILTSAKVWKPT